jgi:hypothetical protein
LRAQEDNFRDRHEDGIVAIMTAAIPEGTRFSAQKSKPQSSTKINTARDEAAAHSRRAGEGVPFARIQV